MKAFKNRNIFECWMAMRRGIVKGVELRAANQNRSLAGGKRTTISAFARSWNFGMVATGNHGIIKSAALCNTLYSASFGPFLAETRKGRKGLYIRQTEI